MIDLAPYLTQAQIAFVVMVIALAVVYYVFAKKPTQTKKSKNKN